MLVFLNARAHVAAFRSVTQERERERRRRKKERKRESKSEK